MRKSEAVIATTPVKKATPKKKVQRTMSLAKIAEERNMTIYDMVSQALEEHGDLEGAAEAIGVSETAIYMWARSRGITIKRYQRLEK